MCRNFSNQMTSKKNFFLKHQRNFPQPYAKSECELTEVAVDVNREVETRKKINCTNLFTNLRTCMCEERRNLFTKIT